MTTEGSQAGANPTADSQPAAAAASPPADPVASPAAKGVSGASSSPADVSAESSTADVPGASSAPADVERKTLLDVAREVLATDKVSDASASSGQPKGGQPADAASGDSAAQPDAKKTEPAPESTDKKGSEEDTFEDLRTGEFGKHPRIRQLLSQLKEARALRPEAEQYRSIQSFMAENGLSADDMAEAYAASALLTHARRGSVEHAKEFLKFIEPLRNELLELTGERIADDLAPRVEAGNLDADTARQLTRERAKTRTLENVQKLTQEDRERERRQAVVEASKSAVIEWEQQTRTRDPDFDKKAPLVARVMKGLAAERGLPTTAHDALALVKDAYAEVSKTFVSAVPKPEPRTPAPPSAAAPSSQARTPAPKTLREVVAQAAGMRAS